jgi:soluble lytic murein transglycosylase
LINNHKYDLAYDISKNNGNVKGTADFADSAWMSGWLALTYKKDAKSAYEHFYEMYNNVNFPVSKSRAAYWAARAAEANNNVNIAAQWYKLAAIHNTTFYGQLAYAKVYDNKLFNIADVPLVSEANLNKYHQNSLVKIAFMLTMLNEDNTAEKFITAAIEESNLSEDLYLISGLGLQMNETKLSVIAAKEALKKGFVFTKTGWPIIENIPESEAEKALVMGIIRQESRFDSNARSSANAMGLMQILPSTAKSLAKKIGVRYTEADLTENPQYNILLGSRYIGDLVNRFDGSYILAIAAYNAGPTNVKRWINNYGDPRKMTSNYEVINWIERIPFKETRSYVQRVLENIQVYRDLLNRQPLSIEDDLLR